MTTSDQIILLLDVDAPADEEGVLSHVPHERRHRHVLRLTDLGWHRQPGVSRDQLHWAALALAVARMSDRVRGLLPPDGGRVEVWVGGHAPLSVFAAVGASLDSRTMHVWSVQRRKYTGEWDVLNLVSSAAGDPILVPGGCRPQEPSDSTGRVAVFLSTQVPQPPREAIRSAIVAKGDDLAGIASLATSPATVQADNIGVIVRQVHELLVDLSATWPHRTGLSLFLAGPASLALATGLALNPNIFYADGRTVELTEYVAGAYTSALSLPLAGPRLIDVPTDADAQLRRRGAFDALVRGIIDLQRHLQRNDVFVPKGLTPAGIPEGELAERLLQRLRRLAIPTNPANDAFEVDTLGDELRISHGLLQALVDLPPEIQVRLGQLFTLHELLHVDQGLGSHNYQGIGRSGVVLEEVDFWADAAAIGAATLHHIARNGPAALPARVLIDFIDAHIAAMRAFDRMEQGSETLRVMPERRLRRYLIWFVQRARAAAVRATDDVRQLLNGRLLVELAPLRGHLDDRYDKIVDSPTQDTSLTVALDGGVRRFPALPGAFVPAGLVAAVREFRSHELERAASYVVREGSSVLTAWRST